MPRWAIVAVGASAALLVMLLALPLLPAPGTPTEFRVAAYATQAAWYAVVVALTAAIASRWHVRRAVLASAIVGTFAIAMTCNVLDLSIPADLAKVWFGALAGAAFVRVVERPWWLMPIALCVPIADAWSVFSSRGVTNAVVERAQEEPRWIEWPTIATPIAGLDYEYFGRLGTVDILFAGLFLAAGWRWRLHVRRIAACLVAALVATSVLVLEVDGLAVPALPMVCLGFLVAAGPALVRDARASLRSVDDDAPRDTR
jgi:hypothetical protein